MNDRDHRVFAALYKDAYLKCFGERLEQPLTETESRLFCTRVHEVTGLPVEWQNVTAYSFFIARGKSVKNENPSTATLDTLARYVLAAPYTTGAQRNDNESHYPYWFLYREQFNNRNKYPARERRTRILIICGVPVVLTMFIFWLN